METKEELKVERNCRIAYACHRSGGTIPAGDWYVQPLRTTNGAIFTPESLPQVLRDEARRLETNQ